MAMPLSVTNKLELLKADDVSDDNDDNTVVMVIMIKMM